MKSAIISSCGLYRYDLRRDWDANLPPLVLGMLNPSKADHKIDDPTIVRGVYRAKTMNCGSLIVWNLGAGRATEPQDWMAMPDPIGPDNDRHIRDILTECKGRNGIAVAGWGVYGDFMNRDLAWKSRIPSSYQDREALLSRFRTILSSKTPIIVLLTNQVPRQGFEP
ncbi:DUF1643 domain-containing protein [Bradyrhizobium sp. sGM-13]|uniref:DUF1643 domain-containing protein n=1 Tax=Bradyrhizobium sp. sGM-13 TaxID=2831781 RepID=UPI001BCD4332|nr:DUF1643 domain-containing protein [Bradyrhizobium sp. sGM-13]